MVNRIQKEMKFQNVDIILTGGFSTVISPGISFNHSIEPFLTLYGMNEIQQQIAKIKI